MEREPTLNIIIWCVWKITTICLCHTDALSQHWGTEVTKWSKSTGMCRTLHHNTHISLHTYTMYIILYYIKSSKHYRNQMLWSRFAFTTAPVLCFQGAWQVGRLLLWIWAVSLWLHVIPGWLCDVEIRSLWGPDHLLQDSLSLLLLNIVLYDSGCMFAN